ncbi:RND superfamily putative drug exporter [Actinoplanes octamycinicus]|uniref:RND superfamily putative drug exporter n=1 Tax=Actinoplanes octamycinicus TaxID=135948 RepID=A0A7W7GUS5_9ACTN|nr:MMPL family transporter [Actinoplanes octamycinicus]MBB4738710.1 RND superfamily putative drug exporter [Actinoplanes octamycinicus]GIE61443.1 RND transporter [Actinoplanes octamycinicus]
MSSALHRLALSVVRHRGRTLVIWLLALLVLAGGGLLIARGTDDAFTIPGSESQQALDTLKRVFPEVSGSSAQIVITGVDPAGERAAITDAVRAAERVDQVITVISPFDERFKGNRTGRAAIITVQFDVAFMDVKPATKATIDKIGTDLQGHIPGATTTVGGDAYADRVPKPSPIEGLGLVVALIVLLITFGSLVAAGLPLLTAILGVGLSVGLLYGVTRVVTVPSTAVTLAMMLGLAVGIDYALFLLSRHRDQLRDGLAVTDSIARATATAGSAVVFAGLTVVIALVGLVVAGIPFLTTMGLCAAVAVAIAVLIAVTLMPALLALAGERLRPRVRKEKKPGKRRIDVYARWVAAVTRRPVLTIVVLLLGLGALALPATELRLALPDGASEAPGSAARRTYDVITAEFGPGYNGPLLVTADIIASHDPVGLMNRLGAEIAKVPGVALVPIATPNPRAEIGIVQVVPASAPDSPDTADLVARLRALAPHFRAEYGVPTAVTGITAVGVDVSARLGGALVPFGILVVGLSLVLLTMVFRSIAVPIKATVGYLLSVGAAFGVTALVFQRGWLAAELNVAHTGSVISFLPIILMGVLFGLAMDYEVFLVARIREEYVHTGEARHAIDTGFRASAPVVVAAAAIMFAVFAAFVPESAATVKPIALSLAVGVFVDAFLVRMTLVPAVLALLGARAWWLPAGLDRRLPSFDVEGEGVTRELALADWPEPGATDVVATDRLRVGPGEIVNVVGDPRSASAFLLAVGGRVARVPGRMKTLGRVLPQRAAEVRDEVVLIRRPDPDAILAAAAGTPPLLLIDGFDRVPDRAAVLAGLRSAAERGSTVLITGRAHDPEIPTSIEVPA